MSVIDWQALQPYREMMGEDFVVDILQTYLDNSQTLVEDIRNNFQGGDHSIFTRAAHTLKSNSAMLGASGLAEICLRLEKAGIEGQLNDPQPDITGLQTAHALVCQEVQKYLEKVE